MVKCLLRRHLIFECDCVTIGCHEEDDMDVIVAIISAVSVAWGIYQVRRPEKDNIGAGYPGPLFGVGIAIGAALIGAIILALAITHILGMWKF